jgi:hypothetical protein
MIDAPRDELEVKGKWASKLVLALCSTLVCLAALEVLARIRLGSKFVPGEVRAHSWSACARVDPDLGWAERPGARARVREVLVDYSVAINSLGWRDIERTPRPAPGVRRVLVVGDSVAWGWGVDQGLRFSDLLDRRLAPSCEVLNVACPGWGTDQELWALERGGIDFAPAIVLVCVVMNDIRDVRSDKRYGMSKPWYERAPDGSWSVKGRPVADPRGGWQRLVSAWLPALSSRSALCSTLAAGENLFRPLSEEELLPWRDDSVPERETRPAEQELQNSVIDSLLDPNSPISHALEELRALCERRGASLVAFALPHHNDRYLLDPRLPRPHPDPSSSNPSYRTRMSADLAAAGARIGFHTVDVDAALEAAVSTGAFLHCGDDHLSVEGHRVVADALEPALREELARIAASAPKHPGQ